jgi:aminocarboxymuconate-semialdehyde decarboxylase
VADLAVGAEDAEFNPPFIDTHGHLLVPKVNELLEDEPGFAAERVAEAAGFSRTSMRLNQAQLRRVFPQLTEVSARLADMDAMGMDVQLVGPMPMHHYWAPPPLAQQLARVTNDAVAGHCGAAPDRLCGLATVPLQHPDLAVRELEHAVRELGLKGVSVSTNVEGRKLSDAALDPVWEAAAALGAVIFIHPWGCSIGSRLGAQFLGVGQPVETTLALSHLIFGGTLDRHPGLKVLAAHGGGYLPSYISRSDHAWSVERDSRGCRDAPSSYLRRIWYDALIYKPAALRELVQAVGGDRVTLGTDYPFDMGVADPVERVAEADLPLAERYAVLGENAAALLGLDG